MSKELVINGKTYFPSAVLSGRFSYTSDYLSKLARDKKVEATRVGRQWFLCEESLKKFLTDIEDSKKTRSDSLRTERKIERKIHENGAKRIDQQSASLPIALAQAFVIVLCGLTVGVLGHVVNKNNIQLSDVSTSAVQTVHANKNIFSTDVSKMIHSDQQSAFIDFSFFLSWFTKKETKVVENQVERENIKLNNYQAESDKQKEVKALVMLGVDTPTTTVADIRNSFSDEVTVTFDGSDTGVIQPVFRERSNEAYRFLLVPITEASEN